MELTDGTVKSECYRKQKQISQSRRQTGRQAGRQVGRQAEKQERRKTDRQAGIRTLEYCTIYYTLHTRNIKNRQSSVAL